MGQIPATKSFNAPTPYSQSPVNQVLQQSGPAVQAPRQAFMALNTDGAQQAMPNAGQTSVPRDFYGNPKAASANRFSMVR